MKRFEDFRLDAVNECLWRNGAQIVLPPKPFAVLRYLVDHPGRLVSHDELLDALWPETYVQPQVLRTYVLDLRKVLGDDASQPRFIQTLPKRGYCFVAPVEDALESKPQIPQSSMRDSSELVGRAGELDALDAQFTQIAEGRRSVVFVTGEAGIGKTALVDAFCRRIDQSQAAAIARGQCVQGVGSREDLYPVLEALNHLCASQHGELACRVLAKVAPAWLPHGSTSAANMDEPTASSNAQRTLSSLCCALEEMSAQKPLILVLEDLDFADESTLQLVSALARRRMPSRLMLLCTQRQSRGTLLQQLKQDLLLRHLAVEVALSPLARPAVAHLISRRLASEEIPIGLDRLIHQRAEGNPLFATAILEHLIAQRTLRSDGGDHRAWKLVASFDQLEAIVPDQLAALIETDIAGLSAEEQCALEAASLMQIAFPVWAVAAALEESVAETEEICDRLAQRLHFLGRAGQDELPDGTRSSFYVFTHQIYRDVIYNRQFPARRDRRHVRIARRLRELFAGREADVAREIALHYEAAGAWREACEALRLSAERAFRRNSFTGATELLERAMRLAENLPAADREPLAAEIRFLLANARCTSAPRIEELSPQKA